MFPGWLKDMSTGFNNSQKGQVSLSFLNSLNSLTVSFSREFSRKVVFSSLPLSCRFPQRILMMFV